MKTNIMKKVIAAVLSASTVFSAACLSFGAFASENGPDMIITEKIDGVSEYGNESNIMVDENGNELIDEPVISTQGNADLPAAYDSREKGVITCVKDQGRSGNCWAFASTSAMETSSVIEGIDTAEDADYSEAHLVWYTHNRRTEDEADRTHGDGTDVTTDPFLKGGNSKKAAATLARWSGMANEESFPFNGYQIDSMGNYGEENRYTTESGSIIKSWEKLQTESDVKQWIIENGSAVTSYYHHDGYLNFSNYAYYYPEEADTSHAVTVVGWDDNYSASEFKNAPEGNGAWLCKNSWDSDWGNRGYFWISYYDASIGIFEGFTAMAAEDYYNNYTYNGSYWQTAYGVSGETQCANVFVADGYETLSAVSTVTAEPGISVKVTVYKNLPADYTTPVDGTQAAYTETYIANEGYHTIFLDEEIGLEPGEIFSVVLEEYNSSGVTFVPIERGETFTCKAGQSFLNYGTYKRGWKDSLNEGYGNLFIQAITKCAHHEHETVKIESTCAEAGREMTVCTQCGEISSEKMLPIGQHVYGGWSEYVSDGNGHETSTRSCVKCGDIQTKTFSEGNVVNLGDFLQMIFSRIMEIFRLSFKR